MVNEQQTANKSRNQESKHPSASFLFVTRNRCPNQDPKLNPLTWSFKTLLANATRSQILEWIVVDDGSTDHTKDTVRWIEDEYGISITLISSNGRKGCSYRRTQGITELTNDLFFMGDDDCLFREGFIKESLETWVKLNETKSKLAVLALPILESRTSWNGAISIDKVGTTDFKNGWFYHNFDKEPLKDGDVVTEPFEIQTFSGVTLGSKKAFIESGNFPDLSMWDTDYSEHLEMAYAMSQNGWEFYYLPKPKAGVIHLKYGSDRDILPQNETNDMVNGLDFNLGELVNQSRNAGRGGCRVLDESFIFNRIGAFVSFYVRTNEQYADASIQSELESRQVSKEIILKSVRTGVADAEAKSGESFQPWLEKVINTILSYEQ